MDDPKKPSTPYFDSLAIAKTARDLDITSTITPQLSSNPFSNIFGGQDPSSILSSSMGIPQGVGMSSESSTPIGNGSAQNSQQSAKQAQSNLQQAFNSVQALYSPMGGRPIAGSEDVRVKADAYGRPYTVVSMTPTDAQGKSQKAETISFGISPEKNKEISTYNASKPKSFEVGGNPIREGAMAQARQNIMQDKEGLSQMGFNPSTRVYDPREDRKSTL
jgi:hypothetical protein